MRDRWLWFGCAVYAALFTWLGWIKYTTHHNLVDFGIFSQTAASAFGCFCNPIEGSHWAFHFSPILYLPGILLAVWKSPLVLIMLQSIACAMAAPPIYAIVRSRSTAANARLAALVALLYPPLAGLAFVDFHENAFAPAAVAWLLWSFDAEKFSIAAIFAVVALAIKEDQAIFLVFSGAIGAIVYRAGSPQHDPGKRNFSVAIAVASLVVAGVFFAFIQPHAAALNARLSESWQPTRFYNWSSGYLHVFFFRGIFERFGFLLFAFAPLAFVPFRSRWMLLAIVPLVEVLCSSMSTTYTMGTHYAGAWAGYVLVAFAMGIRERGSAAMQQQRLLMWAAGLCVITFVVANPLHPRLNLRAPETRDTALDTFLAGLPANLPLATQEEAYAHLALRNPQATVFPELASTPLTTCYALTDNDFPTSPRLQEYGPAIAAYERQHQYAAIKRSGNITLYHSTTCPVSH